MYLELIVIFGVILTILDWLDQLWFTGIGFKEYMKVPLQFIAYPHLHMFVVISLTAPMVFDIEPSGMFTIEGVAIMVGLGYIGYINMYNFMSLPIRSLMILLPAKQTLSKTFSFSVVPLHPSFIYHYFKNEFYIHSRSSERSFVMYFDSKEELVEESVNALNSVNAESSRDVDNETCDNCGKDSKIVYRYSGVISGYKGYQLHESSRYFEENNVPFAPANSPFVDFCEECREDVFSKSIRASEDVDESIILSKMI